MYPSSHLYLVQLEWYTNISGKNPDKLPNKDRHRYVSENSNNRLCKYLLVHSHTAFIHQGHLYACFPRCVNISRYSHGTFVKVPTAEANVIRSLTYALVLRLLPFSFLFYWNAVSLIRTRVCATGDMKSSTNC